jgi:hypothetical protein
MFHDADARLCSAFHDADARLGGRESFMLNIERTCGAMTKARHPLEGSEGGKGREESRAMVWTGAPLLERRSKALRQNFFLFEYFSPRIAVIMDANRWRLGRESLEDAGPEMSHELKSRIQPEIEFPRIMIFHKSKTIVAPTIAE